jgi:hypothetical protein
MTEGSEVTESPYDWTEHVDCICPDCRRRLSAKQEQPQPGRPIPPHVRAELVRLGLLKPKAER